MDEPNFTSRDKQREESRERLFHASLEIFRRDGFRAARVDDITLVAGLSRTSFYFHFPTKEDVLLELTRRLEEPVVRRLSELSERPMSEVIPELTTVLASQWSDYRSLAIDAMTVAVRAEAERLRAGKASSLRAELVRLFEKWISTGVLSRKYAPFVLADAYLFNSFAALSAWGTGTGEAELKSVLHSTAELFLSGALGKNTEA